MATWSDLPRGLEISRTINLSHTILYNILEKGQLTQNCLRVVFGVSRSKSGYTLIYFYNKKPAKKLTYFDELEKGCRVALFITFKFTLK